MQTMQLLIDALSATLAFVGVALVAANVFVMIAAALHQRKYAMRVLAHFSRAVMLLRLSDSVNPSRPYRKW